MENDITYRQLSEEELGLVVGGVSPGNAELYNGNWNSQTATATAMGVGVAAVALNTNIATQINVYVPITVNLPHT